MRNCPVREHESSPVPVGVQQAFRERVADWATRADYPWQTRELFGGYFPDGIHGKYKKPALYVCPETLSVRGRKTPEFGGEFISNAYFQFDPSVEGMFRPESLLSINRGRFGSDIRKLMLVSDKSNGEIALAQSLDIDLLGITQIDAHYDGIGKRNELIRYHLDLAYYVPHSEPRQPVDPIQHLKVSDLIAVDPEIRLYGRFVVEESVIGEADLGRLLKGNNVDNYYGAWTTFDGKLRFRPKGEEVWYLELFFPKALPHDLDSSLVSERTKKFPLTAPHKLDKSWRDTEVFKGIGLKAGYNDRENPEFYRFPFL